MGTVMRNTQTGEYRRLDGDSETPEYQAMSHTLRTDGKPMWEQTGLHDLADFVSRSQLGDIQPEDVGDAGQPTEVLTGTPANLAITPSGTVDSGHPSSVELEHGVGRADEDGGVSTLFGPDPEPDDEDGLVPIGAAPGTITDADGFPTEMEGPDADDLLTVRSDAEVETTSDSSDEDGPSLTELRDTADSLGLSKQGSKAKLQERIDAHDAAA